MRSVLLAVLLAVLLGSCTSGSPRPAATAPQQPPAISPAAAPPRPAADPALLETRLRAVLGSDPRSLCREEVRIHLTGDADVDKTMSTAQASAGDLEALRGFFPAMTAGDEVSCRADWTCHLTLDPKAEFPRQLSYRFEPESPPRIAELWLQVINGP